MAVKIGQGYVLSASEFLDTRQEVENVVALEGLNVPVGFEAYVVDPGTWYIKKEDNWEPRETPIGQWN